MSGEEKAMKRWVLWRSVTRQYLAEDACWVEDLEDALLMEREEAVEEAREWNAEPVELVFCRQDSLEDAMRVFGVGPASGEAIDSLRRVARASFGVPKNFEACWDVIAAVIPGAEERASVYDAVKGLLDADREAHARVHDGRAAEEALARLEARARMNEETGRRHPDIFQREIANARAMAYRTAIADVSSLLGGSAPS